MFQILYVFIVAFLFTQQSEYALARRKWDKIEPQITKFYPGAHYILLTFNDDALSAETTYGRDESGNGVIISVLDTLKHFKARATFFVQGSMVEKYPEIIKRMVRDRHEVANLGWQTSFITDNAAKANVLAAQGGFKGESLTPHTAPSTAPDGSPANEELLHQIKRTDDMLLKVSGKSSTLYRPPYALQSNTARGGTAASYYIPQLADLVHSHSSHQVILWSLVAPGYGEAGGDAAVVEKTVLSKAKKGDVVLLHITPATAAALGPILSHLMQQGFEMLTISEMLSFPDEKPH